MPFLISLTNLFSQSDSIRTLSEIQDCISKNDWLGTALLYEKMSYTSLHTNSQIQYKIQSAEYYKQSQQFEYAIQLLHSINLNDLSDSLRYIILYQTALNYYLKNDLNYAKSELTAMYYLISDSAFHYKSYPLFAIILCEMYDWNDAYITLKKYNNYYFKDDAVSLKKHNFIIDSIFDKKHIPVLKNVNKAITLSTFIPGAGQIYSKNYSEGIISFLLASATLGITAVGIYYQYYFTSLIAGSSLWAKFYTGNLHRAEFLAKKYNYKRSYTFNSAIKEFIVQTYFK